MNRRFFASSLLAASTWLLGAAGAHAQWVPTGALKKVPVVRDCSETGGDVAVSRFDPPAVYLCPVLEREIRARHPGAEHFYLVHEFGHVALHTSDESEADCWAAHELARVRNGRRALAAVIALLHDRPDETSPIYGRPIDRAERIRRCADEAQDPLP